MAFRFTRLEIPDVLSIEPEVFPDGRGFFMEAYKLPDFKKAGIDKPMVQLNHSKSRKNVVRGLHYQINPFAQGKIVRALAGEIFEVAVDLRKGSPFYGKWVGLNLSERNKKMLYIPEGFGHGFCTLTQGAEIFYSCTNIYSPKHERGVRWDDPAIKIKWPVRGPILSRKDRSLPMLNEAENNFSYKE